MKQMTTKATFGIALMILGLALLAGCDKDLGLEGKTFSCNEPSDCADGFVCDMDRQICVAAGSNGTQDATDGSGTGDDADGASDSDVPDGANDAEDTADVPDNCDVAVACPDRVQCNAAGECDSCTEDDQCLESRVCVAGACAPCDFERGIAGDCDTEGTICSRENECVDAGCDAMQRCPEGYACNLDTETCFRSDNWCRSNADCEGSGVCDPSGRCAGAPCDSRSDCFDGEFCTADDRCITVQSDGCGNNGDCPDYPEICSRGDQACIIWRCDYAGIEGACPGPGWCGRGVLADGSEGNICYGAACEWTGDEGCGGDPDAQCVPKTSSHGICAREGLAAEGVPCANVADPSQQCGSGLACVREPGEANRTCRRFCDPWNSTGCEDGRVCAPMIDVVGVCLNDEDAGRCDTKALLAPCGHRAICLPDAGAPSCQTVCRLDGDDCQEQEVCDPAAVPGDVGFGKCNSSCRADSDCSGQGDVCRKLYGSTLGYCAKPCTANDDCPVSWQTCKDGFCD